MGFLVLQTSAPMTMTAAIPPPIIEIIMISRGADVGVGVGVGVGLGVGDVVVTVRFVSTDPQAP